MYTYVYIHTYTCVYTHTHTYIYMYAGIYMYLYVSIHVFIHIHICVGVPSQKLRRKAAHLVCVRPLPCAARVSRWVWVRDEAYGGAGPSDVFYDGARRKGCAAGEYSCTHNIYTCIHIHTHMDVLVCMYIYIRIYVCTDIYIYTTYVFTYMYMYIIYITYMNIYIYICIYLNICIYTCTYMYIYTTYVCTYMYMYIYIWCIAQCVAVPADDFFNWARQRGCAACGKNCTLMCIHACI